MNGIDSVLRADAERWRNTQHLDSDLDLAIEAAVRARPRPPYRLLTAVAVAAAAVIATVAVAVALHRDDPAPNRALSGPTVSSAPQRLSGLGSAPPGQRTLLGASGYGDRSWTIRQASGRGEVYAACVGTGKITVTVVGHGGFDVDCTGMAAGASLPSLGTVVRISGVTDQQWRVAVFGP